MSDTDICKCSHARKAHLDCPFGDPCQVCGCGDFRLDPNAYDPREGYALGDVKLHAFEGRWEG